MSQLNIIEIAWIAIMVLAFPKLRALPQLLSKRVPVEAQSRHRHR